MRSELYLVWSPAHGGWIGLAGGYVRQRARAATFPRDVALHMCHLLKSEASTGGIPVRLDDLLAVQPVEPVEL